MKSSWFINFLICSHFAHNFINVLYGVEVDVVDSCSCCVPCGLQSKKLGILRLNGLDLIRMQGR